ncbi:MAG TPA: hypothetical protein ENN84_01505 [Candidatus Marinimicrobia bacterium]|nr:hypothetical protein [Candidatus Neomarinimicrobiota bacterium]
MNIYKTLIIIVLMSHIIFCKPINLILEDEEICLTSPDRIDEILQENLEDYLNFGYPYAQWILENWNQDSSHYTARYRLEKGEYLQIDSVYFGQYSVPDIRHLNRLMGDSLTGIFSAYRIKEARKNLAEIDYVLADETIALEKTILHWNVKPARFTRFNLLLSYQQGQGNQKNGLAGQVQIQIQNLMRLGRSAELNWQRSNFSSNQISLSVHQRYIWNTPFSLGGSFYQEFRDSLWVERDMRFESSYEWRPGHGISYHFSQEAVFPTLKGKGAGYSKDKRLRNSFIYQWDRRLQTWKRSHGIKFGYIGKESNAFWQGEIKTSIYWTPEPLGFGIDLLGGVLSNWSISEPWELFRLGNPEFLRGAYSEQYLVNRYGGLILSAYWQEAKTRFTLFNDLAYLPEMKPIIQPGLSLSIPAGANELIIIVGFDTRLPWQQGKFHIMWSL